MKLAGTVNYRCFAALAAAAAVALLVPKPAAGQAVSPAAKTVAKKAWTSPRTPDGKPDLQGIWTDGTVTPLERPKGLGAKEFYTDEEYAKLSARLREGDVGEEAEIGAARRAEIREVYRAGQRNSRRSCSLPSWGQLPVC